MDGSSVRLRRQRMLMTQAHLAEASGLSLATIKRVERGENVSFETRRAIAAVLGDEPTGATDAEVSSPPPVTRGVHGTVIPLNEAARAAVMLHPGPNGFVSTSPDPAFLVRARRRLGPKVSVHRFGKTMRPTEPCRVVVGEGVSRQEILAMASVSAGDLPIYEIVPPNVTAAAAVFARMSRIAMICSFVLLAPVSIAVGVDVYGSSVGILANPFGAVSLASVTERVVREMNWDASYAPSWQHDQYRHERIGPDPFADRIRAYGGKARRQVMGEGGR